MLRACNLIFKCPLSSHFEHQAPHNMQVTTCIPLQPSNAVVATVKCCNADDLHEEQCSVSSMRLVTLARCMQAEC